MAATTGRGEIGNEALRRLIGGGALAVATTAGTRVYQTKQLELEMQRNLREFLHRYVDRATNSGPRWTSPTRSASMSRPITPRSGGR